MKGKLTYTMAAVAILWGIVGMALQWVDSQTGLTAIWAGLATFGVRRKLDGEY